MNSNSNSFMRVQVQKKYFFEFKFEFGKMIEFEFAALIGRSSNLGSSKEVSHLKKNN